MSFPKGRDYDLGKYETEAWKYDLPCFLRLGYGAAQGAFCGLIVGVAQIAWFPDSYIFSHKNTVMPFVRTWLGTAGKLINPMTMSAVVCGTFCGVECVVEQLRDDKYSKTYIQSGTAGAVTGLVIGSLTKRPDVMLSLSVALGGIHSMIELNGHRLSSKNFIRKPDDIPGGPSMSIKRINPVLYEALEEFKREHPEKWAKLKEQDEEFYSKQYCSALDYEIYQIIAKLRTKDVDMKMYWKKLLLENPEIADFLEANDKVYKWSEMRALHD